MNKTLVLGASLTPSKYSNIAIHRLVDSNFEAPQKWPKDNVTFFVSTTTLILTTKQISIPIKKTYLNSIC